MRRIRGLIPAVDGSTGGVVARGDKAALEGEDDGLDPFAVGQHGEQIRAVDAFSAAGEPLDDAPGHLAREQRVPGVHDLDRLDQILGAVFLSRNPLAPAPSDSNR